MSVEGRVQGVLVRSLLLVRLQTQCIIAVAKLCPVVQTESVAGRVLQVESLRVFGQVARRLPGQVARCLPGQVARRLPGVWDVDVVTTVRVLPRPDGRERGKAVQGGGQRSV